MADEAVTFAGTDFEDPKFDRRPVSPLRELEREAPETPSCSRLAIIGRGRLGTALAAALVDAGFEVVGPLGRGGLTDTRVDAVLLCVPDGQISRAAEAVGPGPLV